MGDKAKNKAQEVKGSAQKKVGRATGDREMESEGRSEKAKSNVSKRVRRRRTPSRTSPSVARANTRPPFLPL
jgi:uncharacterized protein YjbJ (UPF0337 family)